jgi:hypothetical protein
MAVEIIGSGGVKAQTDAAGRLKVSSEATKALAGFQALAAEIDPGSALGARTIRELDASEDFRLRVGQDSMLWQDGFAYANINVNFYSVATTTMTITQASGWLNLNAGAAVAVGNVVNLRTWRTFPAIGSFPIYVQFDALALNQAALNAVGEIGLGFAAGTATPTDGVFFRWAADGTLRGVVNNNGVETLSPAIALPAESERHTYLIVLLDNRVEFWIDGVLVAVFDESATFSGNGVTQSNALPFAARLYNSGAATAAKRLQLGNLAISLGDASTGRLWASAMAGNELGAHQSPPGAAASQTAQWANSAAPANATLSNTAAGYATLGGLFQFAAVAGAETDYALFAFTVPAGSVTQPGKNLVIRGVRIETFNSGAAVATTPHVLMWALAVGSTAASLATVDSLTAATRGPRRLPLGVQYLPVGAAIGQTADKAIDVNLDAPILAAPGTVVHLILRMPVATATATQVIRGMALINGYFE